MGYLSFRSSDASWRSCIDLSTTSCESGINFAGEVPGFGFIQGRSLSLALNESFYVLTVWQPVFLGEGKVFLEPLSLRGEKLC